MPSGVDPSFRKLWRNHNESYPEKSVRARGENINRMLPVLLSWDADQGKFQRISFRAADPISQDSPRASRHSRLSEKTIVPSLFSRFSIRIFRILRIGLAHLPKLFCKTDTSLPAIACGTRGLF